MTRGLGSQPGPFAYQWRGVTPMELHGYTFIFLADIEIIAPGALTGWERLAYDQFLYSLLGAGKLGDSAVYRKITSQLTDADKELAARHDEPGRDLDLARWLAAHGRGELQGVAGAGGGRHRHRGYGGRAPLVGAPQ